ncbi:MAG: hypothetical protein U9P50_00135 [Patescibacteria group bacterium]|nr:hypothetical protein [Patescibacteria group bacterium]
MKKLVSLLVMVIVVGGFSTVVTGEEKPFINNRFVLERGFTLMEEIKETCPSQTDDVEEFAICQYLRRLAEEAMKRLLEDIGNEEFFVSLHLFIKEIEEILSNDCCLIERNLNFSSDNKDLQRWTKGF